MDNAYTYDAVSNVLGVTNGAALPQSGKAGGQMSHSYTYDALYRLSSATGTYTGADSKTASYTLAMGYDNMHRITSKSQHLTQDNLQFDGTLNVGYDLTYTYGQDEGKKFQLANVGDVNYRTEAAPGEDVKVTNSHAYEYDANGNLSEKKAYRWNKDNRSWQPAYLLNYLPGDGIYMIDYAEYDKASGAFTQNIQTSIYYQQAESDLLLTEVQR